MRENMVKDPSPLVDGVQGMHPEVMTVLPGGEVSSPLRQHAQSLPSDGREVGDLRQGEASESASTAGEVRRPLMRSFTALEGTPAKRGIPLNVILTSRDKHMGGAMLNNWKANGRFLPRGTRLEYFNDEVMKASAKRIGGLLAAAGVVDGAYDAWRALRPGAYRADLWRYMKLWADGGVYMDDKVKLLRDLREWIDFDGDASMQLVKDWAPGALWNAIMASAPRDPAMARVVTFVVNQVKDRAYCDDKPAMSCKEGAWDCSGTSPGYLAITGPMALARGLGMNGVSGTAGSWHFTSLASAGGSASRPPVLKAELSVSAKDRKFAYPKALVMSAVGRKPVATVDRALHFDHGNSSYFALWKSHQVYCDEPGPKCDQ